MFANIAVKRASYDPAFSYEWSSIFFILSSKLLSFYITSSRL